MNNKVKDVAREVWLNSSFTQELLDVLKEADKDVVEELKNFNSSDPNSYQARMCYLQGWTNCLSEVKETIKGENNG